MNAPLDIGRLSTRIRSGEPERAQALAGQVRRLADRQLAQALDGAGQRALARAGLPADAMVAVQQLDLALRVSAGVDERQLAEGWAAAFEAALASLLARAPMGEDEAPVVWFADAWAAERRHLERRAAGLPDAWWAPSLAAGNGPPDAGDTADGLEALAILLRWLARDPPRAVATIAALARADARIATRLDPDAARTLTRRLLGLFAHNGAAPLPSAKGPAEGTRPQPPLTTANRLLEQALECLDGLRTALLAALGTGASAQNLAPATPWLLAALFAGHPALTRLAASEIEHALMHWLQRPLAPQSPAPAASHTAHTAAEARTTEPERPEASPGQPATGPDTAPDALHEIHAGGLLLLLRPMLRLGLLPAPDQLAQGLGDLALTALRRVLAPLPPAERAVAQERERPLLAVFAPECDWRERIATLPIHAPEAADARLDALIDAIPADIAFAPGAERRIFGSTQPAFATAPARRLACLLLRPGVLTVTAWNAELAWPLASIDLALRRAGWDQDPGWLPWLGRNLRLRFEHVMSAAPQLELWLALAAGRLLLRRSDDAGLRRLAATRLDTGSPEALSASIASGAEALFAALDTQPDAEPLARIATGYALSGFDLDLLAFAALPCFDEDAAAAVAALTGGPRRLPVGLALKLMFGDFADPTTVRAALRASPLWSGGLIQPDEALRPQLERRLDPTETLLASLEGTAPIEAGAGWRARRLTPPAQPATSIRRAAAELAASVPGSCLHLCGNPERAEEALACAGHAIVLDAPERPAPPPWAEARLLSLATGSRVALRTDATELPAPAIASPSFVIAPPSFALHGPGAHLRRLEVGASAPLELADAWQLALGCSQADADELAGRNWIDNDAPQRVAATLPAGAGVPEALAELARLTPPRALRLATRSTPDVPWGQLVLPAQTSGRLDDLIRRVRRRVGVQLRWGMGRGSRGRSVVGLLYGESGTGKTLAAEAIATRLQLPMLVVDLSLVVSKYIGETEKNLSELFAAAEGYAALLFFDEADALFGRRTNVQDAHDRYANIEVNYLLQRLESFEGCALLATNLMQGVDDAFLRRFDQVVHFPRPGVAERIAIWRTHLPAAHLADEVSIEQLAERFELTGGEIRNAALSAAFAAADSGTVVTDGLLDAAVAEEFSKLGRPFPRRQGAFS